MKATHGVFVGRARPQKMDEGVGLAGMDDRMELLRGHMMLDQVDRCGYSALRDRPSRA
jgi:hypothetical protein